MSDFIGGLPGFAIVSVHHRSGYDEAIFWTCNIPIPDSTVGAASEQEGRFFRVFGLCRVLEVVM